MDSFFKNPSVIEVKLTAFFIPTFKASFNPEMTSSLLSLGTLGAAVELFTYPLITDKSTFEQVPMNKEIEETASILNMINE
jgi:hypothetical protein